MTKTAASSTAPGCTPSELRPSAKFTGMDMSITTLDRSKDADTPLEIFIVQQDGAPALAYLDIQGQGFSSDTTVGEHVPPAGPGFTFVDFKQEQILMKIAPNGNNTWTFRFDATLHFEDGIAVLFSAENCVLDESGRRQRLFPLSGAKVVSPPQTTSTAA
jgi:hypothetical protein